MRDRNRTFTTEELATIHAALQSCLDFEDVYFMFAPFGHNPHDHNDGYEDLEDQRRAIAERLVEELARLVEEPA